MVDWVSIGAAVRARREAMGLSQQALGDLAGVSHALVGFVEIARRDNYYVKSLVQIADALGLDITIKIGSEIEAPELVQLQKLARHVDADDLAFATAFLERCIRAKSARIAS